MFAVRQTHRLTRQPYLAAEVIPWDSESTEKAHVHCVIIGFSHKNSIQKQKYIFDEGGNRKEAKQINGYMIDAADVFIENRAKPLCPVPEIVCCMNSEF